MNVLSLIARSFTVDPVNLNLKTKIFSWLACFCSIFFISIITRELTESSGSPIIVASMGASAVILFFIPNSTLAQPWPFVGGQICSALVGVFCALNIAETANAAAVAVGGSILVMLVLRCLHPPGAATTLAPVMSGDSLTSLGYSFVFAPVAINVVIMLMIVIIVNRWVLSRDYPSGFATKKMDKDSQQINSKSAHKIGYSREDVELALKNTSSFIDLGASDLNELLNIAEMNTFKRLWGDISCAEIMRREVLTVEFGTEVEEAWQIMQDEQLRAIPVTDSVNRVIGLITWHDFFKYINLNSYDSLEDKLRNFIKRTNDISSRKPESVGQIMSSQVTVLSETEHVAALIPLMTEQGHRQIPIINDERRLVGMIFQADLIAALYNNELSQH